MKIRIIFPFFLAIISLNHILGQEVPRELENFVSPEIHEDRSFFAPNADSVQITSDFLPSVKVESRFGLVDGPGKANLTKAENGLRSYITASLASEFYSYHFIVDGAQKTQSGNGLKCK